MVEKYAKYYDREDMLQYFRDEKATNIGTLSIQTSDHYSEHADRKRLRG